jgi:hypothetical protein
MKNVIFIIIIIAVFLACGTVGYQFANQIDPGLAATPTSPGPEIGKQEQHNLVIVHVDQLDSRKPKLVSIWFVSLFFMENVSPTLTFAQIYPSQTNAKLNQALERSFNLNDNGDPQGGFWKTISGLRIKWEGYLLVDNVTAQTALEWVDGPADYVSILSGGANRTPVTSQFVMQTCTSLSGLAKRKTDPFTWGALVPNHFRSDLRMEVALSYWNRVTSLSDARCEVVPGS